MSGPVDLLNESELRFEPSWNLVRTTHLEIMPHADGSAHVIHVVDDALQTLPADAQWYLEKKWPGQMASESLDPEPPANRNARRSR